MGTMIAEKQRLDFISSTDAADLRWYFSTGRRQIDGCSNFGAMLDRLEQFGIHARPCLKCGGRNATFDDDGNVVETEQDGSGFVWSSDDWQRRKMLKRLGLLDGELAESWNGDLVCRTCRGRGVVPGRRGGSRNQWGTMKVRSSQQTPSDADTGGDGSLARLGYVSRILDRVKKRSARVYALLESFYSPGGESEACLWQFTPAGKTLLRKNNMSLPERQFFANERNRQKEDPNTERALLFQAADRQAADLRMHMIQVWCEVRG
jgi:hypothetical protein